MKKKLIYLAAGSLCHAKICIGSWDYYACLFSVETNAVWDGGRLHFYDFDQMTKCLY